jgi:hypothetical protein
VPTEDEKAAADAHGVPPGNGAVDPAGLPPTSASGSTPASASTSNDPPREAQPGRDEDARRLRDRLEGLVPDIVRKTFYAGLGALFTTEEGIRKLTSDIPLPKDVASYLLSTADGAKDEVLRILGNELHQFFDRLQLSQELAKLLTQVSFEIKTEIRFIPNDQAIDGGVGVKPDIKRKVALKRKEKDPPGPLTPDDPDAD